jgi:hypothetical protein
MFGFHVMDTANVFILIWQFSEPRAALYIIMGDRADPNIIYEMGSKLNRGNPF